MRLFNVIYQSVPLVNAPKIHTDLLWDLSVLFIGLGGLYFLFVFVVRHRFLNTSNRIVERKKQLAPIISNFLFYEDDAPRDEKEAYVNLKIELRELLKNKFTRKILTEILLDLQRDVSGDTRQRIYNLYTDLGLHLDAFKRLKSWRWEAVSQAILELTQMQVEEAYTFIRKFINDRRGVIRKQAQIATVTLKPEGLEYFMDANKYRISEWQQLKLLDVLKEREAYTPPRFRAWLTSKNRDVVLFALRLIKYYNQNDANSSLIQLIKHKNNQIKSEAISCLKEFGVFEAVEELKSIFWRCSVEVKLLLLDAIGELGNEKDIEFLKTIERKEINFNVRSKTLSAINAISPEYIMPSEGIMETLITDGEPSDETAQIPAEATINPIEMTPEKPRFEPSEENTEYEKVLDPETEDEAIFEICFMEELNDILEDAGETEEDLDDSEILPLDFLPMVEDNSNTIPSEESEELDDQTLLEIEVDAETVAEDESFRVQLAGILERIQQPTEPEEESVELDFLPLVVEGQELEENTPVGSEETDLNTIQVAYEEVTASLGSEASELLADLSPQEVFEPEATQDEQIEEPDQGDENEFSQEESIEPAISLEELEQEKTAGLSRFSIFQEFFRSCDAESKLILLDEVLAVGEEKELRFLHTLVADEDPRVVKKAAKIAEMLRTSLEQETGNENLDDTDSSSTDVRLHSIEVVDAILVEETAKTERKPLETCFLELNEPDTSDIFDVAFDLVADFNENTSDALGSEELEGAENSQASFFDSFLSLPLKIIEKFNG